MLSINKCLILCSKCCTSNLATKALSKLFKSSSFIFIFFLLAIVSEYQVLIQDTFALLHNSVTISCLIPSHLQDWVFVAAWTIAHPPYDNMQTLAFSPNNNLGRYWVLIIENVLFAAHISSATLSMSDWVCLKSEWMPIEARLCPFCLKFNIKGLFSE